MPKSRAIIPINRKSAMPKSGPEFCRREKRLKFTLSENVDFTRTLIYAILWAILIDFGIVETSPLPCPILYDPKIGNPIVVCFDPGTVLNFNGYFTGQYCAIGVMFNSGLFQTIIENLDSAGFEFFISLF